MDDAQIAVDREDSTEHAKIHREKWQSILSYVNRWSIALRVEGYCECLVTAAFHTAGDAAAISLVSHLHFTLFFALVRVMKHLHLVLVDMRSHQVPGKFCLVIEHAADIKRSLGFGLCSYKQPDHLTKPVTPKGTEALSQTECPECLK
eukprot:2049138-Amphidinium_carterae.1